MGKRNPRSVCLEPKEVIACAAERLRYRTQSHIRAPKFVAQKANGKKIEAVTPLPASNITLQKPNYAADENPSSKKSKKQDGTSKRAKKFLPC